jgi:hypothetical protein
VFNQKMIAYVNQTGLSRKAARCPETIARKLAEGIIAPDAVLVVGERQHALFAVNRLAELRRALGPETEAR